MKSPLRRLAIVGLISFLLFPLAFGIAQTDLSDSAGDSSLVVSEEGAATVTEPVVTEEAPPEPPGLTDFLFSGKYLAFLILAVVALALLFPDSGGSGARAAAGPMGQSQNPHSDIGNCLCAFRD